MPGKGNHPERYCRIQTENVLFHIVSSDADVPRVFTVQPFQWSTCPVLSSATPRRGEIKRHIRRRHTNNAVILVAELCDNEIVPGWSRSQFSSWLVPE